MFLSWWRESEYSLADWLDTDEEMAPIEDVHQQYLDGCIDDRELESCLAVLVDDCAEIIRDMIDGVDDIGGELSRNLGWEFDTVAGRHGTSARELRRVDGIGETRAQRLRKQL